MLSSVLTAGGSVLTAGGSILTAGGSVLTAGGFTSNADAIVVGVAVITLAGIAAAGLRSFVKN